MTFQSRYYQGWTDDENQRLKLLWEAGYTSTQIAERFNRSRGAILGKIHRMGWQRRQP